MSSEATRKGSNGKPFHFILKEDDLLQLKDDFFCDLTGVDCNDSLIRIIPKKAGGRNAIDPMTAIARNDLNKTQMS